MTTLELDDNSISNISPLEDLTSLTTLELNDNSISDISPLVSNTGLGTGDSVDLAGNPLSYPSLYTLTFLPALQARGVTVSFTSRVPTTLTKISGDAQTGAPGAALADPFIVEVKDGASPAKTFAGVPVTFAVTAGGGTLSAATVTTGSGGRADATLTLGSTSGTNTVTASVTHDGTTRSVTFTATAYQPEDVNKDGDVDVDDLIDIGKHLGGTTNPAHEPDVNGDSAVNNADSQLVARAALQNSNALTDIDGDGDVDVDDLVAFAATPVDVNGDTTADDDDIKLIARIALNAGNDDAAPAHSQIHAALSAQNLQHLVQQARQRNRFEATYRRGLAALERILESLIIPEESALLPNYPNPFNPETWIPYQLASPAEVTLTLYDVTGRVVRTLHLGHQHAGMYRSKSRAAYWDGRNAQGEPVASGVYFYTLVAGEFAATGKMLIRK